MKYFLLVLFAFSFIADARQKATTEEKQWAVPNITYECTGLIFQDWARGRTGSTAIAKTKPFLINMRTPNDIDLTAKDFEITESSDLKSLADTDLATVTIDVKLHLAGANGVKLEAYVAVKPEQLNKEITILGEDYSDSIAQKLRAFTRLWVGDLENLKRDGPLGAGVDCNLKSLF